MANIEEFTKEFYSLKGNSIPEKRKYLNHYMARIKANIKSSDDLKLFTKSIKPRNELERSFKVEILLQLQINDQILDILKGVDFVLNAKIYKNWQFFSDVFSNMDCHTFFNDVAPYISHSCTMKIITRLSKMLKNEDLADEYFNILLEKYSIHIARKIMLACSIDLARTATQTYKIQLTSKELLAFAKKDKDFLKFYFGILPAFNVGINFCREYKKIIQYVGRTDANLFWKLYDTYSFNNLNINVNLGESVFDFLFANDEDKTLNREVCVTMFTPRTVYNVLSRREKMDVLLANFCLGDENEFFQIYTEETNRKFYLINTFLNSLPKFNYYQYLSGAFKLKFGKDLLDYPKYFNQTILKEMPKPEREKMLDLLVKENDELIYLYDTKKSIPLLKEILDKNVENPDPYLKQFCQSCEFHPDEDTLLDVLKYITDQYRHREHLIHDMKGTIVQWKNSEKFKPEIWNLLDEMLAIIEYSDEIFYSQGFTEYLHRHIINSTDNNIPFGELFKTMLNRRTGNFFHFKSKQYCEEAGKLLINMRKKNDFFNIIVYFLANLRLLHTTEGAGISLLDYGHLLEIIVKEEIHYSSKFIGYAARNNIHASFHDLYSRIFEEIDNPSVAAYAQKQPDFFLKSVVLFNMNLLIVDLMKTSSFENFTAERRNKLRNYCLDVLTLSEEFTANKVAVALKLFSLISEETFINVMRGLSLTKLHKIDDTENVIKNVLSKCLSSSSNVTGFLPLAVSVYKNTEIKNYIPPIHRYLYKIPVDQTKAIIQLLSENSSTRLRRLSVTLAYIFLTNLELHEWIIEMNRKETALSVKRHLCKKAFYAFVKNQNEKNWSLLKDNIDLVGEDSRCAVEFWRKLHLISPNYCEKFVTHSFDAVAKDGRVEWCKKKMLTLISPPAHGNLSTSFLMPLLEAIPFYTTRTRNTKHTGVRSLIPNGNYYLEFLFYTSGEKQGCLLELLFGKLKAYVDENWSDFPDDEVFANVYEFLKSFFKYSIKLQPQNDTVGNFYNKWKAIFPASYFQSSFLLLEFLQLYSECHYDVGQFSKKSREMLNTFVDRYGGLILGIYCSELEYFRDAANIDRFSFLLGFIEDKADPLAYSAVVKMLPLLQRFSYAGQPRFEELRCILRSYNEPVVNLHLSEYYRLVY